MRSGPPRFRRGEGPPPPPPPPFWIGVMLCMGLYQTRLDRLGASGDRSTPRLSFARGGGRVSQGSAERKVRWLLNKRQTSKLYNNTTHLRK